MHVAVAEESIRHDMTAGSKNKQETRGCLLNGSMSISSTFPIYQPHTYTSFHRKTLDLTFILAKLIEFYYSRNRIQKGVERSINFLMKKDAEVERNKDGVYCPTFPL